MSRHSRILGAVLAGGRSSRFGSDKALARFGGRRLIDLAVARLAAQVDEVVVVGRGYDGFASIADRPAADLGPLGGLAAALHHAVTRGFDLVLTAPCDAANLPSSTAEMLTPAPAYFGDVPVVGLWPAASSAALDGYLATASDRSVRAWAAACGARAMTSPVRIHNINTAADLEAASHESA